MNVRTVGLLVYENVNMVDVSGLPQVFATAANLAKELGHDAPGAQTRLFSSTGGLVRSSCGISMATEPLAAARSEAWDTFLVAGGFGVRQLVDDELIHDSLRHIRPNCRRFGSICSGALLLAAAGLLDGVRSATHWRHCEELRSKHPAVQVELDALYVEDRGIWTSAGVTAGMDMALAMVEADLGRTIALQTARDMVLFLKRPGGQSQFSAQLASQSCERDQMRDLAEWMVAECARPLTVPMLAERAAMSARNFARVFLREFGTTPGRFLEQARIEVARRALEDSRRPLEQIAAAAGFGSADQMRRTFLRHLHVTPSDYRERFSGAIRTERAA